MHRINARDHKHANSTADHGVRARGLLLDAERRRDGHAAGDTSDTRDADRRHNRLSTEEIDDEIRRFFAADGN